MNTVAEGLAGGRGRSIGLLIVMIPHFSLSSSSICYKQTNKQTNKHDNYGINTYPDKHAFVKKAN